MKVNSIKYIISCFEIFYIMIKIVIIKLKIMQLKTIQDYYEEMYKLYPSVSKSDIKKILQFGWKSLYLHNSYGGDTLIMQRGFWFYCGQLMNDSIKYFEYYKKKIVTKLKIMYKRKHITWDGYYYFALFQDQYNEYLSQKNKRGRRRKNFTFSNVFLYKIFDECNISESGAVAIFKIPMFVERGFIIYKEKLITDKAELILVREPLKFQDILLSNYDFKVDIKRNNKK